MGSGEPDRLRTRLDREHRARLEAESIAERVTAQLYAANLQVERANAVLEAANQSLRDFVAVASHDLRGPLATVMGFAATLTESWDRISEEDKREFMGAISRQAHHLNRIVEDLLTVSGLEAGVTEARIEEICLAGVLEQVAMEFGERSPDIEVSCSSELTVLADPDHLHRILDNYISNAFKYGEPPVEARAHDAGGWAEVHVCDHGDGVPAEFVPRLFGKFARADDASRRAKGTGLGLSIVRGLAVVNGGDAWYEQNRPHGSCFAVRLPRPA